MAKPSLFLIDGNSQMYRAFHAIRALTAPDGRPTNAVYGFTMMLRKLIADHQPAFIAAAFDLAGPTFRSEISADYKANRAPMPPDLVEQVPLVRQACEALGVPVLDSKGFEADDVIGTLAARAADRFAVAIVTSDKDFFQLVSDPAGVRVFNPRDDGAWYDEAAVKGRFGVEPRQVVDVLSLMGDAVDNVKGVPGIGEKGAKALIAEHDTLDALLAAADQVPQKKYREALKTHADEARASRSLVVIRTDVPLDTDLESFQYAGPDRESCFSLFSDLGFRTLVAEFAPSADTTRTDYALVDSLADVGTLADTLRQSGRVACCMLADGDSGLTASLVGLVFSTGPHQARYVPVAGSPLDPGLQIEEALAVLKPVLEDPAVLKVGHDLKFDALVLARHGIRLQGLTSDSMLASYLLDATRSTHTLESAALEYLTYKAIEPEALLGRGAKARRLAAVNPPDLLDFAGERADLAWQLNEVLAPVLREASLDRAFHDLELPLVPVLVEIERAGVLIDTASLARQSQHLERELNRLSTQIVDLAGEPFNINSPKQLSEILFEKLKLPTLKRTGKTRVASTAVEVLEELALSHELPRLVLEWRSLAKLKSTYIDALPQLIDADTGRLHTRFNQAVAATGRLSSSDPNLQNIPIRTDLGRQIRAAFVAAPGHVLISADYSQIELRVLAHLAGEDRLIEAFRQGEDIHDRTAALVFGADSGLDKHELRRRAKIVNYALLYGKTAFTLARDIGVPQGAAQDFIDAYFDGFPKVRAYIDQLLDEGRQQGAVRTLFGRRRLMPDLASRNGQIRARAEREAVNMPIQGTAADILKRAMIDVHAALMRPTASTPKGARMILTVHDELLFEVPEADADEVAGQVRELMEHAVQLDVPLTVDVGIGPNWREAKG